MSTPRPPPGPAEGVAEETLADRTASKHRLPVGTSPFCSSPGACWLPLVVWGLRKPPSSSSRCLRGVSDPRSAPLKAPAPQGSLGCETSWGPWPGDGGVAGSLDLIPARTPVRPAAF